MKILAMTVFCMDYYIGPDTSYIGGNSLNFAVQCKKSGAETVSVLGAVGSDTAGGRIIGFLKKKGFDMSHIYSTPDVTANNKIYITDEGERYFKPDSWTGGAFEHFTIPKKDWPFILSHDVIAVPATDPNFDEILNTVAGRTNIVVDFLDERDYRYVLKKMDKISVAFISGDEGTLDAMREYAKTHSKPIVVTMGAKGSVALYGDMEFRQEAIPVSEVVDTTGCGDAFQAAFTESYFRNHDIKLALNKGAVASSSVLSHFGGVIED